MEVLEKGNKESVEIKAAPLPKRVNDPFALFQQVIQEDFSLPPFSPSSIENNILVMQILEAARISATTNKTIIWDEFEKQL